MANWSWEVEGELDLRALFSSLWHSVEEEEDDEDEDDEDDPLPTLSSLSFLVWSDLCTPMPSSSLLSISRCPGGVEGKRSPMTGRVPKGPSGDWEGW